MKIPGRYLRYGGVAAMFVIAASIERAAVVPVARGEVRVIELICQPGWRAGAGGQYGGVGFDVTCMNGRGRARVQGFTATTYTVRVGVESQTGAADCFFSGDAASAQHTCAEVVLSIH